ncbi:MAG: CpaF family protein [Bacillota bacterium]
MQEYGSGIIRLHDVANAQATIQELSSENWQDLRRKCQERVMATISPEYLGKYRDPESKKKIAQQIRQVVEDQYPSMIYQARQAVIERLTNELCGYGPFEAYLDDPNVTEIIAERYDRLVIEKDGELQDVNSNFSSEEHLRLVVERITAPLGRPLNWSNPTVDARLPDGSRVCAVIPPVAVDGTQITIRKFRPNVSMEQLVAWGMLSPELRDALTACVRARLSILISGGTGSGKTTFLNALSAYINPCLSLITIENPAELQLQHPHVRRWEARPANIEGAGEFTMMSLLITALRSRPDIIIVGEVRGKEAYVLMQALNTGHMGSMTTMHANSSAEAMKRLVAMVTSAGELAPSLVPEYIAEGVDLVVQLMRFSDGKRRLTEIAEVVGEDNGRIITNSLVRFKVENAADGKINGHWQATGNKFSREDTLEERGVQFPGWSKN